MKLSSKLPKRNGLDESDLPTTLLDAPNRACLLIVEVACGKTETTFDEYGDPYTIPTAQVLTAEYVTDPTDLMTARLIARRSFDRRRGSDPLPGVDGSQDAARAFRDEIADTLGTDESLTITAGGRVVTIHGERIDEQTGEVLE